MTFDIQPQHKKILTNLIRALEQGKCASSWLLGGQEKEGPYHFAVHFAHILLCQAKEFRQKPCGICTSCQLFETGNHPDLHPIEVKEGASIKIETICELEEILVQTARQGINKVAIIRDAEKMNLASANAFLKTLEEPPPHTFLILTSHHPSALLPTLISRCQKVFLEGKRHSEPLKARKEILSGLEQLSKRVVFPITLAKEWAKRDILGILHELEIIGMDRVRCESQWFWLDYLKEIQNIQAHCQRVTGLDKRLLLENLLILWWKKGSC